MGWGVIHAKSVNHKLNTKISIEAEVVGTSDYFPYNIWVLMFLYVKGCSILNNTLYQDNQSAIKMEINGRNYCTSNSRHINIWYFFVKDVVDKGEVNIGYCPTHEMLAYFFFKYLQGRLFYKFREYVMGYKHITTLLRGTFSIKKHFGDQKLII